MQTAEQDEIFRKLARHVESVENERAEGFTLRNLAGEILTVKAEVNALQVDMKSIRPRVAVLEERSGITAEDRKVIAEEQKWWSRHWVTVSFAVFTLFLGALVSACVTFALRKVAP